MRKKSIECREVAKLAFKNNYFESAVTQSYYSMYNNLLSLFFLCGIKCENHSASAILLKEVFNQLELYELFSEAKTERIDKQYYTSTLESDPLTKEGAKESIFKMIEFNQTINVLKINLTNLDVQKFQEKLSSYFSS
jgi:uncharacterized protein (UPF0332 family)